MLVIPIDLEEYEPLFLATHVGGAPRVRADVSPEHVIDIAKLPASLLNAMLGHLLPQASHIASSAQAQNAHDLRRDIVYLSLKRGDLLLVEVVGHCVRDEVQAASLHKQLLSLAAPSFDELVESLLLVETQARGPTEQAALLGLNTATRFGPVLLVRLVRLGQMRLVLEHC